MTEAVPETREHPKRKANENPWYLLATLYGEPSGNDHELQAKNRVAWNRYIAGKLSEQDRARLIRLIEKKLYPSDELTPFTPEEMGAVGKAFAERKPSTVATALPDLTLYEIDFSNIEFNNPLLLQRFCIPVTINFFDATFSEWANFEDATFSGRGDFQGATFSGGANFRAATFSGGANFRAATFSEGAFSGGTKFDGATFSGWASFHRATFSGWASFHDATFSGEANFEDVTFSGGSGVAFAGGANFEGATFSEWASFHGATFSGGTSFRGVTFSGTTSFVNAEMKGQTSFSASFKGQPPDFSGAKLHEGTIWHGVKWPDPPKDEEQAVAFVHAYERLKLEMDKLKKFEDELNFFALEMQSRRVLYGRWKGFPIVLYGLISDYGRSYVRPLYGVLVTTLAGSLLFWPYLGFYKYKKALGLSLANTFGAFGFRREFIAPQIVEALPSALKLVAAVQTIIGGVLLFLFSLALRNRFRMK